MTDLIIENGRIVDGKGAPAFDGSVLVQNGKIAAVGEEADCQRQSKSEPKGSAKCCHFGVCMIAA